MPETVEDEILALLRKQEAATERGDAEAVVADYADDVVIYDLPPPLEYRGSGKAHIDGLNHWFATWEGSVKVELAHPTVIVDGDIAVVFGLSRMRGTKKGSGPVDSWNRRTLVLRRRAAQWRIIHEHGSYPLEMDGSGKAATDLKPETNTHPS